LPEPAKFDSLGKRIIPSALTRLDSDASLKSGKGSLRSAANGGKENGNSTINERRLSERPLEVNSSSHVV
jgi:hypothetical protein